MYPIASVTPSGSTTAITFSSIPQTFQHLQLRFSGMGSLTNNTFGSLTLGINGDTTSNHYYWHYDNWNTATGSGNAYQTLGAGAANQTSISLRGIANSSTTTTTSQLILDIYNYSTSSTYFAVKYIIVAADNGSLGNSYVNGSGLFLPSGSTTVTSLTLTSSGSNFSNISRANLYGIWYK